MTLPSSSHPLRRYFKTFGSLKIAVVVFVGLVTSLAVGTVLESTYDTQNAKYFVYGAAWFRALLVLFGVNIFCAAMTRWPWQKKHTPFLLAHLGILMLLLGALITDRSGIDGNLILSEGQTSSFVELGDNVLVVRDPMRPALLPIPWRPPARGSMKLEFPDHGLVVQQWIAHADRQPEFTPASAGDPTGAPLVVLEVGGGPLGATQSLWLHALSARESQIQLGPAEIVVLPTGAPFSPEASAARLEFRVQKDRLEYRAFSSRAAPTRGEFRLGMGGEVKVPWSMGAMQSMLGIRKPLKVVLKSWLPLARDVSTFTVSRVQYGEQAPPPAIQVANSEGETAWVGFSERKRLSVRGSPVELEFMPRFAILPFSIKLERFEISRYEGSMDPSAYRSQVRVESESGLGPLTEISMNAPLEFGGYTFYQASFIPGQPRPTTTVLSVNRDPGRSLKYWGSIVLVLGCILLFARKYKKLASRDLFPTG